MPNKVNKRATKIGKKVDLKASTDLQCCNTSSIWPATYRAISWCDTNYFETRNDESCRVRQTENNNDGQETVTKNPNGTVKCTEIPLPS